LCIGIVSVEIPRVFCPVLLKYCSVSYSDEKHGAPTPDLTVLAVGCLAMQGRVKPDGS